MRKNTSTELRKKPKSVQGTEKWREFFTSSGISWHK